MKIMTFFEIDKAAYKIAKNIVVKIEDENYARRSSSVEEKIIQKVAQGALSAIRDNKMCRDGEYGVAISTAEYILGYMIPDCNCYDTIYLPLMKIVEGLED